MPQHQNESSGFFGCLAVIVVALIIVALIVGLLSGDMSKGIQGAAWVGSNIIGAIFGVVCIFGFMWLISKK